MTEQQLSGSVREAAAGFVPEQAEPQVDAPVAVPTEPDPLAAAAVDLAREAAEEVAQPGTVGRHLSVSVDSSGLTLHAFDCTAKGYRGWRWAVTLAHVPGSDRVTVCDTVLLPGAESIMAPAWVPWSDRLAPGDLGAGDELPYKLEDPNLVPGYTVTDEDDADQQLFWELGLGRERVLGPEGVASAADRWHRGPHGPTADVAVQASASCVTCAYFVPLSGVMRQQFGACANEWSPADGSVVTADFGCGAHSETDLEMPAPEPLSDHILDETVVDRMDLAAAEPSPGIETGSSAEGIEQDTAEDAVADSAASAENALIEDASGEDGVLVQDASAEDASVEDGGSVQDASVPDASVEDEAGSGSVADGSARMPRDAGGTTKDLVEPVASPEDLITVRPLDEQPESGQSATTPETAVEEAAQNAGVVHNEAVEAVPGGQFVQAEPDPDQTPPPALGTESPEAEQPTEAGSTEAAQGEAVEAASEYTEQGSDSAELSLGLAVPGGSVLESDGALHQPSSPAAAEVEAAQAQVASEGSSEARVGEADADEGAEVPQEQPRSEAIAVDSAEAEAAEAEPAASPQGEQAEKQS
jgi:hypothetical protein